MWISFKTKQGLHFFTLFVFYCNPETTNNLSPPHREAYFRRFHLHFHPLSPHTRSPLPHRRPPLLDLSIGGLSRLFFVCKAVTGNLGHLFELRTCSVGARSPISSSVVDSERRFLDVSVGWPSTMKLETILKREVKEFRSSAVLPLRECNCTLILSLFC